MLNTGASAVGGGAVAAVGAWVRGAATGLQPQAPPQHRPMGTGTGVSFGCSLLIIYTHVVELCIAVFVVYKNDV